MRVREPRRPQPLSLSLRRSPATALLRAAELAGSALGGGEPGAPAGCGVAAAGCDARATARSVIPSPPPSRLC